MLPEGAARRPCEDCGAPLGGREGCEAAYHEMGARAAQDPAIVRTRAVHDAYCLQHPEPFTRSVKSFYVHFLGLCVAIDRPADPRAQAAIWHDVRVPPGIAKPPAPVERPAVTVAELMAAEPAARPAVAQRYVEAEWTRWRAHHALARAWLAEALATRRR